MKYLEDYEKLTQNDYIDLGVQEGVIGSKEECEDNREDRGNNSSSKNRVHGKKIEENTLYNQRTPPWTNSIKRRPSLRMNRLIDRQKIARMRKKSRKTRNITPATIDHPYK